MATKLIEVSLPLDAINAASAREKSIRHGHPSTLHLWWARRPLAACRAVLFASLVDDPSAHPDLFPTETEIEAERERLFEIIRRLVIWENSNDEQVLAEARAEILKSTGGNPPPVLDPFCGGGSIPLEAQRLGLEAHASDLNPVAVLITKALIEIPPRFAGQPPVNPDDRKKIGGATAWPRATGLAADVRYYGAWMRDEAERRIGHLYPKAQLPAELGGGEATVIAWLWARTVTCPNPACRAEMPLISSYWLSTKAGKKAWVKPVVDHVAKTVRFEVRTGEGEPKDPPKLGRGGKFRCLVCDQITNEDTIRAEGRAGQLGAKLMAVVAEGHRGRTYLPPTPDQESAARDLPPVPWVPAGDLPINPRWFSPPAYGMTAYADLFTPRQLVALTTFSELVGEARDRARQDAIAAGLPDDGAPLEQGGHGATAYADAVGTYLGVAVDRSADRNSSLCSWDSSPKMESLRNTFARQALPMVWDFGEGNVFASGSGNWQDNIKWVTDVIGRVPADSVHSGYVGQISATSAMSRSEVTISGDVRDINGGYVVSTDPPYYDNIGYADLSDYFYVWLRASLGSVYPTLLSTLLTPKKEELIASPYRFEGSKAHAQEFFEAGLGEAFVAMHQMQNPDYPLTVYYAFKQSETETISAKDDDAAAEPEDTPDIAENTEMKRLPRPRVIQSSTGWETMLEGLISSGFMIHGTWPMRTELANRMIGKDTNALASSIVLVCRARPENAPTTTRAQFTRELKQKLPAALKQLQQGNLAPVDLAQSALGPGMAIYSRYREVREPSGDRLPVRAALQLINQVRDETLSEHDSEYDVETGWAINWFSQFGMSEGPFGDADRNSQTYNVSVAGLVESGIVKASRGKVNLVPRESYPDDWTPGGDKRLTDWEIAQHLIRALDKEGHDAAAAIVHQVGARADHAKELAYRLYTICEQKGWSKDAQAYNTLVVEWPAISGGAAKPDTDRAAQGALL